MTQNKSELVQKTLKKCYYDMAILQNFLFTPWDNYRGFRIHYDHYFI